MLLRSSSIHTLRIRRLTLGLVCLGVSLLAAMPGLNAWKDAQSEREREALRQQSFLRTAVDIPAEPPFLTGNSSERVYAPGQTALAFAAGFQPHEALFIRLYHRTRGLIEAYVSRADERGQFAAAHPLSLEVDGTGFTPPGRLWFQVEGLNGLSQEYPFRLESSPARDAPPGKGVYPSTAVPGSSVVLWCSGNPPGEVPMSDVKVDNRSIHLDGLRFTIYPTAPDGLLLARLLISHNDPTGNWTVFLGTCELHFSVSQLVDWSGRLDTMPH